MRQLAEFGGRDDCPGIARPEPSFDVLFRPEEIHRASGEDDVVPPARGGNQGMEKQTLVINALFVNLDRDRLSTVWARRFDPTIRLQGSTDANCVPRAVAVPPAT